MKRQTPPPSATAADSASPVGSGTAQLQLIRHRGGLTRSRAALRAKKLTVGFMGGSISDPRPGYTWPEPVCAWLVQHFPDVRIVVENAAIGATGSDLAVFRAERDILARGCDLVFVEYAVNDSGTPTERRNRTREGLLRKLLRADCDVVLTYTFCQDMHADMQAGRVPASIAEFEALAEHYGIGSVWMGLQALREVEAGLMRWETWLPDGIHPQHRGSAAYAAAVNQYLAQELPGNPAPRSRPLPTASKLPPPLNPANWEQAKNLPWEAVSTSGPWQLVRWPHMVWMDQVLATAAPGAALTFDFTGRVLLLGFDFGKNSGEFRWRVDGGPWTDEKRERFDWVGEQGWFRTSLLAEELKPGRHRAEIEVTHGGAGCKGSSFHLALIGVVP